MILDRIKELRDFSHLGNIFTTDVFHLAGKSASYYRPMLVLSFMLNAFFSSENPFGYHLFNVVAHLFAVCLIFALLLRLGFDRLKSFCLSILFLVHPALVQAVAWIPGRNDSLLTVFILLAFLSFIKYLKEFRLKDLCWHFVFFLCALLTKESAVVFPVLCILYFFLISADEKKRLPVKLIAGWIFCLAAWFFLRTAAVKTSFMIFGTWVKFTLVNSPALLLYLGKAFFPFNLSVLPILQDSSLFFGIAALVLIFMLMRLTPYKDRKGIMFGWLWFLLFLFFAFVRPGSPLAPADFLEHRLYLPMIGLMIVLIQLRPCPTLRYRKTLIALSSGISFLIFLVVNIVYVQNFKDRLSFWRDAVQHSPHAPLAHANLGAMYYLEGKNEAASHEYYKALDLNPRQEMVYSNLGLIFMREGKWQKAEHSFLLEIQLNPSYADAYYNFGLLRYAQKRWDDTYRLMEKTLQLDPHHAGAQEVLARDFMNGRP